MNKIIKRKNRTKITKENKQKIKLEKETYVISRPRNRRTRAHFPEAYSQDLHTPHFAGIINNGIKNNS